MKKSMPPCVLPAILAAAFITGCGSVAPMNSAWRLRGVTIDSAARDWKSPFVEMNNAHVFIGMQNDSTFFYLRILAPDEQFRRQIAGPGMTVWFEPEGGKKTGILYPMGGGMRDLEILGEESNDRTLFSPIEVPGIRVRTGSSEGSAMYELRMPLQPTREMPYAIGAQPGSRFRIEIVTEKELAGGGCEGSGMGDGRSPGGGEGGGGFGGGGRRGGYGGGRGGRGPGAGSGGFDALDIKADVHLAPPAAGAMQ